MKCVSENISHSSMDSTYKEKGADCYLSNINFCFFFIIFTCIHTYLFLLQNILSEFFFILMEKGNELMLRFIFTLIKFINTL